MADPYGQMPNIYGQQVHDIQEQIRESEKNLMAQRQVLMKQQQIMIDETIKNAQEEQLRALAQDFNFNFHAFDVVLQPIAETCTKDSISNCKSWIFSRCQSPVHYDIVAKYLFKKITATSQSFDHKLHLLYLINDLLNHCARKGPEHLKQSIERVIIPIYCFTYMESDDAQQQRLKKLLKLWETNQYVDQTVIQQLENPAMTLANYKASVCNEFAHLITPITSATNQRYNQLHSQHNEFVAHHNSQLKNMPPHPLHQSHPPLHQPPPHSPHQQHLQSHHHQQQGHHQAPHHQQTAQPSGSNIPNQAISNAPLRNMPMQPNQMYHPPQSKPMYPLVNSLGPAPRLPMQTPMMAGPHLPLPTSGPPPFTPRSLMPHTPNTPAGTIQPTSVPNPQFFSPSLPPVTVIKDACDVPYYELPAGLMVPLIKLEDSEYNPIDPDKIRLPPPAPPNERLLKAVEVFYAPPSYDRPRNSEGWEQLSLDEFYRAKSLAKKDEKSSSSEEEYERSRGRSKRSSSNSPKRRYKEESPRRRHQSTSSSSESRSPSPRRKSPSRSKSQIAKGKSTKKQSPGKGFRSKSRSPSPPSFVPYKQESKRLDESNKGHQMLKKMGWNESTGLGISGQGIQDPVETSDVRGASDYAGVGIPNEANDPYEAFRKNKGAAFMYRVMKARAERE